MRAKGREPLIDFEPKQPKDRFGHLSREERLALKELAEVESAIAALEGRKDASPEDLAFARKDAERMRQNLAEVLGRTEQHMRDLKRTRAVRATALLITLGAAAAVLAVAVPIATATLAARAAASEAAAGAAAPFVAEGFREIQVSDGLAPRAVTGERGRCFVAVAGAGAGAVARPALVRLTRGPVSVEGPSVGVCTCGAEPIQLTPVGSEPIEIRILAAPASVAGGADLLSILPAPPAARVAEVVERACAEEAIDSYLAAHPIPLGEAAPPPRGDPAPPAPPAQALVEALGPRLAATAPPGRPLVTVPVATEACFLALSDVAEDALSLRLSGGERPLSAVRGSIAFCGAAIAGASVWRDGAGAVRLFSLPARRAGGLLGMRELTSRLGRPAASWVAAGDLAFDARAALLASGLAPREGAGPQAGGGAQAGGAQAGGAQAGGAQAGVDPFSFVGVSVDARSMLVVDPAATDVLCRPEVEIGAAQALCLQSRPGALGDPERPPPGVVQAPRPFWLPVVKGQRVQNERVLAVLAFARRLAATGFELTSLTGFVEVPGGIEITGRSGEKEIVALAMSSLPPFLHPLTRPGAPAWQLAGAPLVVPLAAGATVKLTAAPAYLGPKSTREILIWRR